MGNPERCCQEPPACREKRNEYIAFAVLATLSLFVWVKSGLYYGTFFAGHDGQLYYAQIRSIVIDGDLDFSNEVKLTPRAMDVRETGPTSRYPVANKYPIGCAVGMSPWFLLAHGVVKGLNHLGWADWAPDGYSPPYGWLVSFGQHFYGLLGLWIMVRWASRLLGCDPPWLIAAFLWLGTNLLYYAAVFNFMAHIFGFFLVCLFVTQVDALCRTTNLRGYVSLGLIFGLLAIARPTNVIFSLYGLRLLFGDGKRPNIQCVLIFAAASCLPISLQMMYWYEHYGALFVYSYKGEGFMYWANPKLFGVLFSTNHGLFLWHPVLLFALGGAWKLWSIGRKNLVRVLVLMIAAITYANASWWIWWFGPTFGARAFIEAYPFFFLLITAWIGKAGEGRAIKYIGCLFVAWNLYLLTINILAMMPYEGYLRLWQFFPLFSSQIAR